MAEEKEEVVYLFISQSCEHCRTIVQQIQAKASLMKKIQVVSVENTPRLPPGLTKVPALLVNGQIKMGSECFEFVENYGELEASPTYSNSSGFESDGFSYLGGGTDSSGTDSFSFLGAQNGSEGIDTNAIDNNHKQETGQKNSNNNAAAINMENLTQQRNQDVQQMQRGPPPGTQKIY